MADRVKPHYLRGPATTWTPPVVISFDTESLEDEIGTQLVHTLRCWAAKRRLRDPTLDRYPRLVTATGTTPLELAEFVHEATEIAREVWCFAHNLGFDLSTSSLPFILAEQGWEIKDVHLGDESCWWALRRDRRRLVLTDSWSWTRCSLEEAAHDIRRYKTRLPTAADPLEVWLRRCRHDAELLDDVMDRIMSWWEQNDLGRFGVTGAGCGWAAMRRQIAPRSIVVGPDEDRTPLERSALFGGRQEVYRVGEVRGAWSADYDLVNAFCNIAARHRLPVRAVGHLAHVDDRYLWSDVGPEDVIANATITTDRPVAPCRIGPDVWWPVGTFRTTLSGPELRYVASTGARVELHDGWLYRVDMAMSDWALWCLELVNGKGDEDPQIVRRMAKGWSRSVIGRFAARTSEVVAERPAEHLGWHLVTGNDLQTGAHLDVLTLGGVERTIVKDVEPRDGFAAVTAFVEGICRATLGRILDSRDPRRLLQCNTDGWWEHRALPTADHGRWEPLEGVYVVRKRLERSVTVLGANHVRTATERRFAGVAADADEVEPGTFVGHDWPSMRWQLEHATAGTYVRPERTVEIADSYVRRWVLADGQTIPATVSLDLEGNNSLEPWSQTRHRRLGDELAPHQVEPLAAIVDDEPPAHLEVSIDDEPLPGRWAIRSGPRTSPLTRVRRSIERGQGRFPVTQS